MADGNNLILTTKSDFLEDNTKCPLNGKKGKRVQNQTIKALLSVSLNQVQNTEYFFCSTQDCPVVYFSRDGNHIFNVDDIREKVYQKEPETANTLICYCFQHKRSDLQNGSSQQRQAIISEIKRGISAEKCACDLRNPQGSCCLGNVTKLVKMLDSKF